MKILMQLNNYRKAVRIAWIGLFSLMPQIVPPKKKILDEHFILYKWIKPLSK